MGYIFVGAGFFLCFEDGVRVTLDLLVGHTIRKLYWFWNRMRTGKFWPKHPSPPHWNVPWMSWTVVSGDDGGVIVFFSVRGNIHSRNEPTAKTSDFVVPTIIPGIWQNIHFNIEPPVMTVAQLLAVGCWVCLAFFLRILIFENFEFVGPIFIVCLFSSCFLLNRVQNIFKKLCVKQQRKNSETSNPAGPMNFSSNGGLGWENRLHFFIDTLK